MRLPRVFGRRRRYEELVTRHLDGVLDAAGEARLQELLSADQALADEVRELEAVAALLHAEPLVEAPRSFALPYAPAPVPAAPRPGALPWMQAATAMAALLLVTLIGVDLVVAPEARLGASEAGATAAEPPVASQAAPPPDAPAIDSAFGADVERDEADAEARSFAREPEPAPAPLAEPAPAAGRSTLDWAQLALGAVTATLAIGVAFVSWRAARRRA